MSNLINAFYISPASCGYGSRVWCHADCPGRELLKANCVWGNYDKSDGSMIAFEFGADASPWSDKLWKREDIVAGLTALGMVESTDGMIVDRIAAAPRVWEV